jgi:hypothetical protein
MRDIGGTRSTSKPDEGGRANAEGMSLAKVKSAGCRDDEDTPAATGLARASVQRARTDG